VRRISTGTVGTTVIQLRGSRLSSGGVCRPRVFVDGIIFLRGDSRPLGVDEWGNPERLFDLEENPDAGRFADELNIDDIGHPSTIAAVEIYRSGAQVPVQFGGTSIETQCGVIVIWTKIGTLDREQTSR
ncbi:MAG: hypothetical protein OEZ54_11480, partial [Gemmatimonadota bacterium]|nr:hypothetical protein [Gemmatimonadota bacterium]